MRTSGWALVGAALAIAACGLDADPEATGAGGAGATDPASSSRGSTANSGGGGGSSTGPTSSVTGSGASGSGGDGGGGAAPAGPTLVSTRALCKLINDKNTGDPTANATHTRANLMATDLGIPVAHGDDLFVFFGDSIGYKAIWPFSESVPDAVGYASRTDVAANPASLCDGLRLLTLPPGSGAGHAADPAIEADFAGAAMTPPAGHALGEFIHNPSGPVGADAFPQLPGSFEVPSGAFSANGSIYVFYTTVTSPDALEMKASYLAKWDAPSTSGTPGYDILYAVDERFDAAGPLGGDFINVAAEVSGDYVYLFGTGAYRASPVHLARKALTALDAPGGFEVYDPAAATWYPAPHAAAPILAAPGFGETSVRSFANVGRWMFLAEDLAGGNRIVASFAAAPEGPWSDVLAVHDMADPVFLGKYCCAATDDCEGEGLFNCGKGAFYGSYLLPDAVTAPNGAFTVSYTLSTWSPYNVALFSATFAQ